MGSEVRRPLTPEMMPEFSYAKRWHFQFFQGFDIELYGAQVDPDYCDLKAYQDLLVLAFIENNVAPGSRLLEVGGGESRILRHCAGRYECWNLDPLEGAGSGPTALVPDGYRLVRDALGNFSAELPEGYFDFVFSISALEHVPYGARRHEELHKNVALDMDRVLKPGGYALHCFDVMVAREGEGWRNDLQPSLFTYVGSPHLYCAPSAMRADPDLYVTSERYFSDCWLPPLVHWAYADGMPSSGNVFWQKPLAAAPGSRCWEFYRNLSVERDESYPRISLVTPSYNQGRYLEACIESALCQKYPNLEYVVMDGGSDDGSVEIIRRYAHCLAYWQSAPDGGQYRAIDAGFSRTSGDIMTWLNSDDMFHPGSFSAAAAIFCGSPQVSWIMGRPNGFDAEGRQSWVFDYLPLWSREKYLQKKFHDPYVQQEGTFWRRSLWNAAGGYLRKDLNYAGDLELWARFFRTAQLYTVDRLLAGYRQHDQQKMAEGLKAYHEEAAAILDFEAELYRLVPQSRLLPAPPAIMNPDLRR